METLGYFIVIFISLCLLSIFIIIIEYFRPIFLDWLLKKEYRLFSFLFLSLFSVSSYSTYLLIKPSIDIFYCIFYVFVIVFSTIACFFIFFKIRKQANNETIDTKQKNIDNENKISKGLEKEKSTSNNSYDFKINYNKTELEKIFDRLDTNNLIELVDVSCELLDKNLFVETLSKGILPKNVLFKLKMDNIQTGYFFDNLKYKSKKLTQEKLLKIFDNNNSGTTPRSISTSKSKSNEPKQKEILESIFKG
jgi:hypothetical protein